MSTAKFIKNLLLERPLYDGVDINSTTLHYLRALRTQEHALDSYCPFCERDSTFKININSAHTIELDSVSNFQRSMTCARDDNHVFYFWLRLSSRNVRKVGQFPSYGDINLYDVKQYAGVIEASLFREFTKAIGLAAHGVGIGSFVYLRRIFESFVEEARQAAQQDPAWEEEKFRSSRMSEKIELLSHHLPAFLVENKAIYSILSKGIHELSEQECLDHFVVLKTGIEIILEARLAEKKKQEKQKQAALAISAALSKLAPSSK